MVEPLLLRRWFLCVLALSLSFCSMLYELALARTFATITDDASLWESVTIGFYLLGIGVGTFAQMQFKEPLLRLLVSTELYVSAIGALGVPVILCVHGMYRIYLLDHSTQGIRPLDMVMLSCQAITLILGVLAGVECGVLLRFFARSWHKHGDALLLTLYNFGSLLASLTFGLVLVPSVRPLEVGAVAACINAGLALLCWGGSARRIHLGFVGISMFGNVAVLYLGADLEQFHLKNGYYNDVEFVIKDGEPEQVTPVGVSRLFPFLRDLPRIKRFRSSYQDIDIVPDSGSYLVHGNGVKPATEEFALYLNGHYQFSSVGEGEYHEFLAHVPIAFSAAYPRKILVLGAGDGFLARELLKYDHVMIRLVELDPAILALARAEPLRSRNAGALDDSRVEILTADAFAWLRTNGERYDAIYLDFPSPYSLEGMRLYSREFYQMVRQHLHPNGFAAMDVPINLRDRGDPRNQTVFATLFAAGFGQLLAYTPELETFVVAVVDKLSASPRLPTIKLSALTQGWLDNPAWRMLVSPGREPKGVAHSVFKPQAIGYKDSRF